MQIAELSNGGNFKCAFADCIKMKLVQVQTNSKNSIKS